MKKLDALLMTLTPKQAAIAATIGIFVTVIGGLLLAYFFRVYNRKVAWKKIWKKRLTRVRNPLL